MAGQKQAEKAAPAFEIVDVEKPAPENPWAEHAKALNDAGEGRGIVVQIPTEDFDREHLKFQAAARAEGFTARLADKRDSEGFTHATYEWRPAVRRKPKPAADTATDENGASGDE